MTITTQDPYEKVTEHINKSAERYINVSHFIHTNPEIGNQEVLSSAALIELLEEADFTVEKGVAGHPTSFLAKIGDPSTGPSITYLAEYDALPGIGHACGHNLIGTTSVAAAIALSKTIDRLGGQIIVAGTPAEEGGDNGSAKGSFVKHALLDDTDIAFILHPSNKTRVSGHSLAVDPVDYIFHGKSAHAAAAPEEGVNALDAVIQLFNGINALRQHLTDDVRIHGIIPNGGEAPNVVPDYARARFFIRANSRQKLDAVRLKVNNIASGAALATGTTLEMIEFQNKIDNLIPNNTLNSLFTEVFQGLGEEVEQTVKSSVGSTDTGNVSHVTPTIHPYIKIGDDNLVLHTDQFRDAASSPRADQALLTGARGLAYIAIKLLKNPNLINQAKQELARRLKEERA